MGIGGNSDVRKCCTCAGLAQLPLTAPMDMPEWLRFNLKSNHMAIGKAISIAIDQSILDRVDVLQPSHLTRKAFVNQLLFEAVESRNQEQLHKSEPAAK